MRAGAGRRKWSVRQPDKVLNNITKEKSSKPTEYKHNWEIDPDSCS